MQKPIINFSLSTNGNPWWVALHNSGVTYEVQINQKTGNALIGMGMVHSINKKVSVVDLLKSADVQNDIARNFNQETLGHILRICDETLINRKEVPVT